MKPDSESAISHHFIFPDKSDPCSVSSCRNKIIGAIIMPVTDKKRSTETMLVVPICEKHSFNDLTSTDLEAKLSSMALEEDSRDITRG